MNVPVLDGFGGMHDGWGWLVGGAMMLLVWGTIIWGAIFLFRRTEQPPASPRDSHDDAVGILRRRFAAGEIEQAEFESRLRELEVRGGPSR